jgi:hypothetical protein
MLTEDVYEATVANCQVISIYLWIISERRSVGMKRIKGTRKKNQAQYRSKLAVEIGTRSSCCLVAMLASGLLRFISRIAGVDGLPQVRAENLNRRSKVCLSQASHASHAPRISAFATYTYICVLLQAHGLIYMVLFRLHSLSIGQPSVLRAESTKSTAEELIAIKADIKRLIQLTKVKDHLLVSKDANLASKDQVIACKSDLIVYATEELQQYRLGRCAHIGTTPSKFAATSSELNRLAATAQQQQC